MTEPRLPSLFPGKDPLQDSRTPYEILGVPLNANTQTIETAFNALIAKFPQNSPELQSARKRLVQPAERLVTDLFFVADEFLRKLSPTVLEQPNLLLTERMNLAASWVNLQKKQFPNFAATHCLAVLFLNWAVYREKERLAGKMKTAFVRLEGIQEGFTTDELWLNAIACWSFLANSDDFWKEWLELKIASGAPFEAQVVEAAKGEFEKVFVGVLFQVKELCRKADDLPAFLRLSEYEFTFRNEMEIARQITELGLTFSQKAPGGETRRFKVAGGKLMLGKIGFLDMVCQVLKKKTLEQPGNERLERLCLRFAPLVKLEILVNKGHLEEALREIEALPEPQRKSSETEALVARITLEKGNHLLQAGKITEAFQSWDKLVVAGQIAPDLKKSLLDSIGAKSRELQKTAPDAAIRILEQGLRLMPGPFMKGLLALGHLERGLAQIAKGQKEAAPFLVEAGIRDLEKTLEIDPCNAKARESLKGFEDIQFAAAHKELAELLKNKKWDQAIPKMEALLRNDPVGNAMVAKKLSAVYFQTGMEKVSKGVSEFVQRGVNDFRKSLQFDPTNAPCQEQLTKGEGLLFRAKNPDILSDISGMRFEGAFKKLKTILERDSQNEFAGEMLENCCFQWILAEAKKGNSTFSAYEVEKYLKSPLDLMGKYKSLSPEEQEKLLAKRLNGIAPELLKLGLDTLTRDAKNGTKILMASAGVLKAAYKKDPSSDEIRATRDSFASQFNEKNLARMTVFLG